MYGVLRSNFAKIPHCPGVLSGKLCETHHPRNQALPFYHLAIGLKLAIHTPKEMSELAGVLYPSFCLGAKQRPEQ